MEARYWVDCFKDYVAESYFYRKHKRKTKKKKINLLLGTMSV